MLKNLAIISFLQGNLSQFLPNLLSIFNNLNPSFNFHLFIFSDNKNLLISENPNIHLIYIQNYFQPHNSFFQTKFIIDNKLILSSFDFLFVLPPNLLSYDFLNSFHFVNSLIYFKKNKKNDLMTGGNKLLFFDIIEYIDNKIDELRINENYNIDYEKYLLEYYLKNYDKMISMDMIESIQYEIESFNLKPKSLIIKTCGGFGNLLFQILCGLALSIKFNRIPYITYIENYKNIQNPTIAYRSSPLRYYLFDKILKVPFNPNEQHINQFNENQFSYNENINEYFENNSDKDILYLNGYYQSTLYFREYFNEIKNKYFDFRIKKETNKFKRIIKMGREHRKFVSLHIRGTDYIKHSHFHLNLSKNYYLNILYNHLKINEDPSKYIFIIFTDDKEYVKKLNLFENNNNIEYYYIDDIFLDQKYKNMEEFELFLMSEMDIIICANSSYSLMASYFSNAETIFIPNKWFVPDKPFVNIPEFTLPNKNYLIMDQI